MTIKTEEQQVTELMLESLIEKFIHVPKNMHDNLQENGQSEKVNVWFAGKVAGFEKAVIRYDYETATYVDEAKIYYNVLLSDGMAYVLGEEVVINLISEDEFADLLARFQAENSMTEAGQEIIEGQNKILIPGEDF